MRSLATQVRTAVEARGGRVVNETADRVEFSMGDRVASLSLVELGRLCEGVSPELVEVRVAERVAVAFQAMSAGPRPVVKEDLLPRLRPPNETGPAWSAPLAGGRLSLCLIADRPSTIRYLSPMDVVDLGLGIAAARSRALDNLRALAPQGRWTPAGAGLPGHRSQVMDGHDGSRILVADHWFEDAAGLFVLAPTRDIGLVLPVSAPDAFGGALLLHEVSQDLIAKGAYPVSADVFWLRDGELEPLQVAGPPERTHFVDLPGPLAALQGQ